MVHRMTAAFIVLMATAAAHAQSSTAAQSTTADARESKTLNLSAYVELLRSDVRTLKVAIITEVMGFTEAEDKAFWPIYREYDAEMSKLGDERVAMIADYANNFSKLTDEVADKLAAKAIDLESRRRATLAKCYERVKAATSPRTALRFLQVEHQLQLLIDLQIASALPVAEVTKTKETK